MPKIPFVTDGEYNLDNLCAGDAVEVNAVQGQHSQTDQGRARG